MAAAINDPILLDGVFYQTTDGIRADTSSRGVDLAGALVLATYSDGSTESLTWAAFDPYTFGGATGMDVAMSFGFAEHILTTTKLLTSLTLDLAPASSVFDITTTMEDDLEGINTPTSKNGFPFLILSDNEAETGSVTVTYSNIVSLTGLPPAGDLFTTMLIDFSALAAGGLMGEIRWNSDIDTLQTAGDLVPVVPVITTNTVTDTQDEFVWTTFTDTFENNVRTLRELTYDNGRMTEVIYEGGVKSQTTVTDTLNAFSWDSYVSTFASNGDLVRSERVLDDGKEIVTTFLGGTKSSRVTSDVADVINWTTFSVEFDITGHRTSSRTVFDDGRVLDLVFENDIRSLSTFNDGQDAYAWDSRIVTFDSNGDRESRTIIYDDGREVFLSFVDDLIVT